MSRHHIFFSIFFFHWKATYIFREWWQSCSAVIYLYTLLLLLLSRDSFNQKSVWCIFDLVYQIFWWYYLVSWMSFTPISHSALYIFKTFSKLLSVNTSMSQRHLKSIPLIFCNGTASANIITIFFLSDFLFCNKIKRFLFSPSINTIRFREHLLYSIT